MFEKDLRGPSTKEKTFSKISLSPPPPPPCPKESRHKISLQPPEVLRFQLLRWLPTVLTVSTPEKG